MGISGSVKPSAGCTTMAGRMDGGPLYSSNEFLINLAWPDGSLLLIGFLLAFLFTPNK